jgi:hypothetical protein
MGRLKVFGMALMAVCAVAALAATSALAAEVTKILPEPTAAKPLTYAATSGEIRMLSVKGVEIKCKKATSDGAFTTSNFGNFDILFAECKGPMATTCTSMFAAKGSIAAEGKVDYLLALEMLKGTETALVAALVFVFEAFTATCENKLISTFFTAKGCIAARAEPTNVLTKATTDVFDEYSSGETKILEVLPVEGTVENTCLPEIAVALNAYELFAMTGTITNEKFTRETKEIEIELMN